MGSVHIKSGSVRNIFTGTGDATGDWHFKDSPESAIQATVTGTGSIGCTVTIQVSNDGVTAVSTPAGTITLAGTTSDSDGFIMTGAPWKWMRMEDAS